MIKFCHIAPTKHIVELTKDNGAHLLLAHLIESDKEYREYYANLNDGKPKIMDNSAYEMHRQGKPTYPSDNLIDLGKIVKADYIVMPDYPKKDARKTIDAAVEFIPKLKEAGFKTFFVPQSLRGDIDGYIDSVGWGINNADLVGISILGAPNALGMNADRDSARYYARYALMTVLFGEKILQPKHKNKLHFLGMTEGPKEIHLTRHYAEYIYSWDSSAAVWAGLNGVAFDDTWTGLVGGKIELDVDFNFHTEDQTLIERAKQNIKYIGDLIENIS